MQHAVVRMVLPQPRRITASWPHAVPIAARSAQMALARHQVVRWRRATAASASVCMALTTALAVLVARGDVAPHVVEAGLRRLMVTDQAFAQPAPVLSTPVSPAEAEVPTE